MSKKKRPATQIHLMCTLRRFLVGLYVCYSSRSLSWMQQFLNVRRIKVIRLMELVLRWAQQFFSTGKLVTVFTAIHWIFCRISRTLVVFQEPSATSF